MLQQLLKHFNSIIKSLDILYVLKSSKPCSRIMVHEDNLDNTIKFLKDNNLNTSISDFKVIKLNLQSEFYSDKSIKADKDDSKKGYFLLYLSKDNPEKAKQAENQNNHTELGKELGYPSCCSKFFNENFDIESKRFNDYTLAALKNSKGHKFPFHTNITARHFDTNLLSHFPCNLNCEESIKIGKQNLNLIKNHSSELADKFEKTLKNPVLYTEKDGIFIFKNNNINNNIISYNEVESTIDNDLFKFLKMNKKIEIIDKNSIKIGDNAMENIGFMLFY